MPSILCVPCLVSPTLTVLSVHFIRSSFPSFFLLTPASSSLSFIPQHQYLLLLQAIQASFSRSLSAHACMLSINARHRQQTFYDHALQPTSSYHSCTAAPPVKRLAFARLNPPPPYPSSCLHPLAIEYFNYFTRLHLRLSLLWLPLASSKLSFRREISSASTFHSIFKRRNRDELHSTCSSRDPANLNRKCEHHFSYLPRVLSSSRTADLRPAP